MKYYSFKIELTQLGLAVQNKEKSVTELNSNFLI